jgi:hypothetical protein
MRDVWFVGVVFVGRVLIVNLDKPFAVVFDLERLKVLRVILAEPLDGKRAGGMHDV